MNEQEVNLHWDVILALKEGKTIQCFSNSWNEWRDTTNPVFHSEDKYRVKPEPKSYWVNIYITSTNKPSIGGPYDTKEQADHGALERLMARIDCIEIVMPE